MINAILAECEKWVGYTEKDKKSEIGDMSTYDFGGQAGSKNYQCFSAYLESQGLTGYQGQAWCDTFIDACFVKVFGISKAKELLGGFASYTPTSANFFKNLNRFYTSSIQTGDIIFFKNDTRICHTGIVYKVDSTYVYTIEGNTKNGVYKHMYKITDDSIAGYGRPPYTVLDGWYQDKDGWHYGELKSGRYLIDDLYYYFNDKGIMQTGSILIDGVEHFFNPSGQLTGAELVLNRGGNA